MIKAEWGEVIMKKERVLCEECGKKFLRPKEWVCGQCKKTYATEKEAFRCWLNHDVRKEIKT